MAITAQDVITWLGLKMTSPDANLNTVVATVNAFVVTLPVVANVPVPDPPEPPTDWPADVKLGATMLAARYYRRRNSPSGVEAITEGGAQYVARYDPDAARLLRIDQFVKPGIG